MKDNTQTINDLAKEVLDEAFPSGQHKVNEYTFDPITILMIISIILTLARVWQECRKNKLNKMSTLEKCGYLHSDANTLCLNNTFFTRLKVKSAIRKHLTRSQYKRDSQALLDAIMKVGSKVTEEQTTALLELKNV